MPNLIQLTHIDSRKNLTGNFPATQSHGQGNSQTNGYQNDHNHVVQQVGFDLQLADRNRNTDDDHQALGDPPQTRRIIQTHSFSGAAHQPVGQLRQQYTHQQHQRGTEHFR
ncbi:hypothetical protein D3C78_1376070 [compost metagenome]